MDPPGRRPASWALVGSMVAAHGLTAAGAAGGDARALLAALILDRSSELRAAVGGQYAPLVADEPWRLVRSVWLHADALHLGVNAIALLVLGRLLEPWVGSARFLWWFALSGVVGSIASHAVGLLQSDGASGGAFGLLGAVTVLAWRNRERLDPEDRSVATRWLPAFVVGNLVLSAVLPFVDAVGHVGGLACGLLLGAFARPEPPGRARAALEALGFAGLAGVAALGPILTR